MCSCKREAYWSEFSRDGKKLTKCFGCGEMWAAEESEQSMRVAGEWRGLPGTTLLEEYRADEWELERPWPVPYAVVVQHHFSISLSGDLGAAYPELSKFISPLIPYLILPVADEQQRVVWFVARAMGEAPRPYLNPPGPRHHWISWSLGPRKYGKIVLCEGIGDAAFVSQWADSIGLCGRHYNGSLNHALAGQDVVIALDGDLPGFAGSVEIAEQVSTAGAKTVKIYSVDGKDPTDFDELEIQEMLA